MSVTATGRYGLTLAPTGLALVQDLLNTRAAGRPRKADLLTDPSTARTWFDSAVELWAAGNGVPAPRIALAESDVPRLRDMRAHLATAVGRRTRTTDTSEGPVTEQWPDYELGCYPASELDASLRLSLDLDGALTVRPEGEGAQWLAGAVLGEIQAARLADTWRRLKLCRNGRCTGAFYDRSRNNSGVWHDVHTCGNAANLRASRARRRAQDITA